MADAPPFDPTQPFKPVSAAPPFDPTQPFQPADEVSTGTDMAKAAVVSPLKGLIKGLGFAGDAAGLLNTGIRHATDFVGLTDDTSPKPDEEFLGSGQIRRGVEKATGPLYDAKTQYGKYVESTGEALGNPLSWAGPGGLALKAGAAGVSGLGAAAGEHLTGSPVGGVIGGIAAPLAAGSAVTTAANAARRRMIPTTAQHFTDADNGYNAARGYGVEIGAHHVENLADDIVRELHTEGYRDIPGTPGQPVFRLVDELREPVGVHATIDDIDAVRKALRRTGKNWEHRDATRRATTQIDDFMANLTPAQVAVNPQYATRVGATLSRARASSAAAHRSEDIEEAVRHAEETAAAAGWGGNTTNRIKQELHKLPDRGLTPAEQAARDRVVHGTRASNFARYTGSHLSPNTLTTPAHGLAIYAGGLPYAGFAAAGMAGRIASGRLTRGHLHDFHDMVRMRSPLGQATRLPARQTLSPYVMPALAGGSNPYQP